MVVCLGCDNEKEQLQDPIHLSIKSKLCEDCMYDELERLNMQECPNCGRLKPLVQCKELGFVDLCEDCTDDKIWYTTSKRPVRGCFTDMVLLPYNY